MKTPERGTLNRWATTLSNRAHGCGRSEQILLKHVGCEPRKDPAAGSVFFLTSPFIELIRTCRVLLAGGSGLMNGSIRTNPSGMAPVVNPEARESERRQVRVD